MHVTLDGEVEEREMKGEKGEKGQAIDRAYGRVQLAHVTLDALRSEEIDNDYRYV